MVDQKYRDESGHKQNNSPTKRLSRQSRVAECAIRNFKKEKEKEKNIIKPRILRKLIKAIHDLNNNMKIETKAHSAAIRDQNSARANWLF